MWKRLGMDIIQSVPPERFNQKVSRFNFIGRTRQPYPDIVSKYKEIFVRFRIGEDLVNNTGFNFLLHHLS